MFLSKEELQALTNRIQYAAQVRTLRAMGIQHCVRPDGSVAVMRGHIESMFGMQSRVTTRTPVEPNWGALHATSA
ncbi:DUF4224 domain-containing protein [Massilia phyllosphaerae]|uniref:DUF4224 domain-containing protein n=1 Tax=Massilia phyllosphaerae TaxID=3106034 RepID=UPI002B1CBD29|nr:DUF4224 domain-containing protein [Massilia sp. SGZ-792]